MNKIIVLGATGNIGLAVLNSLKESNVEVYGGVRNTNDFDLIRQQGATPILVDFTQQDSLNKALQGMHRAFLVTPLMQNPEAITQLVLHACAENGVEHLVRSTALGADSNGQIQMARWAGKSEDLIKASGIRYTIIRPNNFLQNFINFHSQTIKEHNGFYMPNGDAKLGMVDVNDIATVAQMALISDKHYNKTYELSGLALTNAEYANTLSKVLGRTISYIDVPEEKAKESMLGNGMPDWLVNAMMELNYIMKQGWTADYTDDFKTLTGREYTDAPTFFETNKAAFE